MTYFEALDLLEHAVGATLGDVGVGVADLGGLDRLSVFGPATRLCGTLPATLLRFSTVIARPGEGLSRFPVRGHGEAEVVVGQSFC